MKICITAQGDRLDAPVDPRFGRCAYFLIIDSQTGEMSAVHNNGGASGGSGVQAGQTMADHQVEAVLTGNVGPNAYQTLQAAGITVYAGISGTVQEALERFRREDLPSPMAGPSVESHFGEA